jgi:hypothetical protein
MHVRLASRRRCPPGVSAATLVVSPAPRCSRHPRPPGISLTGWSKGALTVHGPEGHVNGSQGNSVVLYAWNAYMDTSFDALPQCELTFSGRDPPHRMSMGIVGLPGRQQHSTRTQGRNRNQCKRHSHRHLRLLVRSVGADCPALPGNRLPTHGGRSLLRDGSSILCPGSPTRSLTPFTLVDICNVSQLAPQPLGSCGAAPRGGGRPLRLRQRLRSSARARALA